LPLFDLPLPYSLEIFPADSGSLVLQTIEDKKRNLPCGGPQSMERTDSTDWGSLDTLLGLLNGEKTTKCAGGIEQY
jgi:hypothetical protein